MKEQNRSDELVRKAREELDAAAQNARGFGPSPYTLWLASKPIPMPVEDRCKEIRLILQSGMALSVFDIQEALGGPSAHSYECINVALRVMLSRNEVAWKYDSRKDRKGPTFVTYKRWWLV